MSLTEKNAFIKIYKVETRGKYSEMNFKRWTETIDGKNVVLLVAKNLLKQKEMKRSLQSIAML